MPATRIRGYRPRTPPARPASSASAAGGVPGLDPSLPVRPEPDHSVATSGRPRHSHEPVARDTMSRMERPWVRRASVIAAAIVSSRWRCRREQPPRPTATATACRTPGSATRSLTSPSRADTDRDRVPDGQEDPDRDGLTNRQEYVAGMNPRSADTDHDGIRDGREDTDHDGLRTASNSVPGRSPYEPTRSRRRAATVPRARPRRPVQCLRNSGSARSREWPTPTVTDRVTESNSSPERTRSRPRAIRSRRCHPCPRPTQRHRHRRRVMANRRSPRRSPAHPAARSCRHQRLERARDGRATAADSSTMIARSGSIPACIWTSAPTPGMASRTRS